MPLACEANAPPTEHHPVLTARLIHMPKACPYKFIGLYPPENTVLQTVVISSWMNAEILASTFMCALQTLQIDAGIPVLFAIVPDNKRRVINKINIKLLLLCLNQRVMRPEFY